MQTLPRKALIIAAMAHGNNLCKCKLHYFVETKYKGTSYHKLKNRFVYKLY